MSTPLQTPSFKGTPLQNASFKGDIKEVKQLIAKGSNVNSRDSNNSTPLHLACYSNVRSGKLQIVKELVEAGAEVNALDNCGYSPLHYAASYKCLDVITFLVGVEGVDVQGQSYGGERGAGGW